MYTFLSSAILVKTTGNYVSAVLSVVCKLVLMYNFLKIIYVFDQCTEHGTYKTTVFRFKITSFQEYEVTRDTL